MGREEQLDLLDRRAAQPSVDVFAGRPNVLVECWTVVAEADEEQAPVVRHPGDGDQSIRPAVEIIGIAGALGHAEEAQR